MNKLLETGKVEGADGLLAHRHITIQKCYDLFKNNITPLVMVETGCQSSNLLHAQGLSTSIFATIAKEFGGHLHTVDIREDYIEKCKTLTSDLSDYITYHHMDSIKFLQEYDGPPIDFLYLDSYDFYKGIEEESREHQIREMEAAFSKMNNPSLILLDDANVSMWFKEALNSTDREGKTYYTHRLLLHNKAKCLIDAYQRLYLIGELNV